MTYDERRYFICRERIARSCFRILRLYFCASKKLFFTEIAIRRYTSLFFPPCNRVLRCIGIFSFIKVSTNDDANGRRDVKLCQARLLPVNQAFTLRFTVTDRALEIVCLQPFQYFPSLIRALVM